MPTFNDQDKAFLLSRARLFIAQGDSIPRAAHRAGIDTRTLKKWLAEPEMRVVQGDAEPIPMPAPQQGYGAQQAYEMALTAIRVIGKGWEQIEAEIDGLVLDETDQDGRNPRRRDEHVTKKIESLSRSMVLVQQHLVEDIAPKLPVASQPASDQGAEERRQRRKAIDELYRTEMTGSQ